MPAARTLGTSTAISLVIANMVGSGIYTSLGFQLSSLHSLFAVLMLWVVGGVIALCGSLVYAELGAALPQNGGEYHFLSELYHPLAGFLSGWVSAIVGFAAPVAAVSIALGRYVHSVAPALPALAVGVAALAAITALHSWHRHWGARFQRWSTMLNVLIMLGLIISCFSANHPQPIQVSPSASGWAEVWSPTFATNLYWVSYAYTGWNAASYIAGEIKDPARQLPRALIAGTCVVAALYVLLNYAFLRVAPVSAMQGQLEVAFVAAGFVFGPQGAQMMGIVISVSLLSTMSAMTFAGPRVSARLGTHVSALAPLGRTNGYGVPSLAVIAQSAVALLLVLLNQFQLVIDLIGFTLALSTTMAVAGLFILRKKMPQLRPAYRCWGYPVTPLVYLALNGWMLYYGFWLKPWASLGGLAIIATGAVVWRLGRTSE